MNPLELLPPDTILAQMQQRSSFLLATVEYLRKSLNKAPAGRIKMIRRGGNVHCYQVTDCGEPAGRYISVAEGRLIQFLAQKGYDEKALREAERELSLVDNFISKYRPETLSVLYKGMPENRRALVTPVQLSNEEYTARWFSEQYKGKDFDSDAPELLTAKGERVRSKSEMIIADTLARHGVPYKYEHPLQLNEDGRERGSTKSELGRNRNTRVVYPDFTCLNLRTRKQFLWEHLGRMDDPDYAKKTVAKLRSYSKNGYVLGQNLILTMECDGLPLDRKDVETLVKNFLL